ncbi:MAG: hypothetical protein ACK5L6_01270 [Anaerorhabdus sp.]|uniref:hypothetical protein n=1 Tax=Anaerorhabdus sp. TaxID=1872524 RepID=UPI003A8AB38E
MKKNTKIILKSLIAMLMVLAVAGCTSTPTQPSETPAGTTTPEASQETTEAPTEGNTLLVPVFVKDREAGAKYETNLAQVQVNVTSDTVDVNTITALDVRAFYDASACEVGKECKVQVQVEITNDAIDATALTMTTDITEGTVVVTK